VGSVVKGYKTNAVKPIDINDIELPEEVSEEDVEQCLNLIGFLIDRIESSGHNQVVSTAFTASGFCAFYGIDTDEMWNLIEDKIRSNSYLSKGTDGYITTAKTMFNKGLNFPTALKKKEND